MVFLACAASSATLRSDLPLPGVCGRIPARRDKDLCAAVMFSLDPSESARRDPRVVADLMLTCWDWAVDTPAGRKGALPFLSVPRRESGRSGGERGLIRLLEPSCLEGGRLKVKRVGDAMLLMPGIDLLARKSCEFVVVAVWYRISTREPVLRRSLRLGVEGVGVAGAGMLDMDECAAWPKREFGR